MSDNTLFLQLQVFDIEPAAGPRAMVSALSRRLREKRIDGVIYGDANDHRGIGLLTWATNPGDILDNVHALLGGKRFSALTPRPGWVMFGRVGSDQPYGTTVETLLNGSQSWAVWYPVRNKPEWGSLDAGSQQSVHDEHIEAAKSFIAEGRVSYARLACHGLDPEDNDYISYMAAADLGDISSLAEAIRGTAQVSTHTDKMGPVFVGRKIWQNPEAEKQEEPVVEEEASEEAPDESNEAAAAEGDNAPDKAAAGDDTGDEASDEA